MSKEASEKVKELFFPYYINQGRLLDIYAILNDGYSEYVELTTAISEQKAKSGKADVSGNGGFKIFKFGASVSGGIENKSNNQSENKEKKVQTVTSVLSIVKSTLEERGYLKDIHNAAPGQFICIPVVLRINSIKSQLEELAELTKLAVSIQNMGIATGPKNKPPKAMEDVMKAVQVLFSGEEILFDTDDYAVIGNIVDSNLYQSTRSDIIGAELNCLAQVKRVFPNGCELMKNTIFTKIKDSNAKEKLVKEVSSVVGNNVYDFDAVAVASISDKPVYQLEIIALYQ